MVLHHLYHFLSGNTYMYNVLSQTGTWMTGRSPFKYLTHLCSCAAMCTESIMRRRASEICLALTVCCSNFVFTADCEIHSYKHNRHISRLVDNPDNNSLDNSLFQVQLKLTSDFWFIYLFQPVKKITFLKFSQAKAKSSLSLCTY